MEHLLGLPWYVKGTYCLILVYNSVVSLICKVLFRQDGAKAIFKGNPPGSHDSLLKSDQCPRKKLVSDGRGVQLMNSNILVLVHGFMKQFLSGGYNGKIWQNKLHSCTCTCSFFFHFLHILPVINLGCLSVLMQSVRDDIEKDHPTVQKSDILNFVKVAKFVISFQYHYHRSSASKVRGGFWFKESLHQ